ncbi:MAG TPA: helix-turn-helix domain-containing protein [Trebonia sp.]
MEHHKADVRQMAGHGAPGDDTARFLNELRQLRDGAGLGQAELAARAHYPYDLIRAAEVGPTIPDLPVLSAYVRGCGGTTEEWEERWRSLTRSPSQPIPTARHAGRSDAATAGARIGSAALDAESPDPSVIIAALNRVAEDMASTAGDALPEAADDLPADDLLPAAAAPAPEPPPLTSDQLPAPEYQPAGWDPIRVSSAWPALRPSSGDTGTAADPNPPGRGPAAGGRTARGAGRSGGTRPAAPWKTPPQWEPAPSAASPESTATGGGAAAPGPASRTPSVAAPASGARSAGRRTGPKAGSSRTRLVVIAAVLLCLIAVLLVLFA